MINLRKYFWVPFVVIFIALLLFALIKSKDMEGDNVVEKMGNLVQGNIWPDTSKKYITAVPVDLDQIMSITKYRSCAGHIRNGYNFDKVLEDTDDRSMKHYVLPVPEYQGTIDKVRLYAPFDGEVYAIYLEKDKGFYGRISAGNGIDFATPEDKNVLFGFGHLYFAKEFKVGDKVQAGELVGYAALGEKGNDFDIDLKGKQRLGEIEILGSAFDHMNGYVLSEFAKYGVTPENTKFSKEYRDNHPCDDNSDDGGNPDNSVTLKH